MSRAGRTKASHRTNAAATLGHTAALLQAYDNAYQSGDRDWAIEYAKRLQSASYSLFNLAHKLPSVGPDLTLTADRDTMHVHYRR